MSKTNCFETEKFQDIGEQSTLLNFLILMRPKQWIKNLFVFAGLLFSGNLFNFELATRSIYAFAAFCLASSSTYIINDILDAEKDRLHPAKRCRPIASGKVRIVPAGIMAVLLGLGAIIFSYNLNIYFFLILSFYMTETLLYSIWLKKVIILELFVVSSGFVLRAIAGVVIIEDIISPWLLVCTFLLSLFIILNKRRHELEILDDNAGFHRKTLSDYSISLLQNMTSVVTSSIVVTYSLYTFTSEHSIYLMATIPFVVYGIFRYLYIIEKKDMAGSPETIIIKDKPMLINLLLWVIISIIIVYGC
ncbi:MAG: Conserved membrane protein, possible 4-hydroxybenzoate octaprenyltransferase [Firmicutes bacterium]|nr:Conserved membrane protein, possible 4-hydroxybenzoate octaprenyltransferase [Bacillota bacterium]MDI6705761.1 decaprenyl-phosphate phosphoribosyltransferase [Bacillota bacterium]